jgi:LmbE family N-acetylglucosaminyl deacetylase
MILENKNVLLIVAHPDDEVLGCGGLISKYHKKSNFKILVIAEGSSVRFQNRESIFLDDKIKSRNNGTLALRKYGITDIVFSNLPCGNLSNQDPKVLHDIITFEANKFKPNIVFTHSRLDNHQDHRLVHEAVQVAFRPIKDLAETMILSFETLSSSEWNFEDNFSPNCFLKLSELNLKDKIEMLEQFPEEVRDFPFPRSGEGLRTLAAFRGMQSGLGLAEAFKIIRYPIS